VNGANSTAPQVRPGAALPVLGLSREVRPMTWISSLIMTLTVGALFGVRRSSWDAHQIEILSLRNKLPLPARNDALI
jgi:hypothetical protein